MVTVEGPLVLPHRPGDPRQLVGQPHRRLIGVPKGPHFAHLPRRKAVNGRPAFFRLSPTFSAERAPWISRARRCESPCLVMRPRRRLPPLECSFGVIPSQLAKCRPLAKRWIFPIEAWSAVAVITPMPGGGRASCGTAHTL